MKNKLKKDQKVRFLIAYNIVIGFLLFLIIGISLSASRQAHADTTWCNMYGDSKVCNTYRTDGTMTQETETPYGNSTVKNRTESPYKSE